MSDVVADALGPIDILTTGARAPVILLSEAEPEPIDGADPRDINAAVEDPSHRPPSQLAVLQWQD